MSAHVNCHTNVRTYEQSIDIVSNVDFSSITTNHTRNDDEITLRHFIRAEWAPGNETNRGSRRENTRAAVAYNIWAAHRARRDIPVVRPNRHRTLGSQFLTSGGASLDVT